MSVNRGFSSALHSVMSRLVVFFCLYVVVQVDSFKNGLSSRFARFPRSGSSHAARTDRIPPSIIPYSKDDSLWRSLKSDALKEAQSEPLLASFMHSSILSHSILEQAIAFHMANLLSSSAMISTQIQALFLEAFDKSPDFRRTLREDIKAVKDRDPAVKSYTDVILYFKGFQALQAHRVAHWLWNENRQTIALFLYSRSNVVFNIDIHPAAKLGSGILIDHGTGVVIGETAIVGNNVSMLHKVTLGGTGLRSVQRHPIVGDCVLLGAGCTLLGPIRIGEGAHIGASSMVLESVPPHSVAVGVPAKIIARKQVKPATNQTPAFTMETNVLSFDI